MGALILKLRTWWETADRTQRSVTIFGSAFLVVLLCGTFFFASRPKMAPIALGLNPAESGAVRAELQKMGVSTDFDSAGNVLVPSQRVQELSAQLAAEGKLPASSGLSVSDQNKLGAMDTPAAEREKIRSALENRLASILERISGVRSATVAISMGSTNLFVGDEESNTSASVQVEESANGMMTAEKGRTIAQMVANGVPKLKIENVMVSSADGRVLFEGGQMQSSVNLASEALRTQNQEANRRERELQSVLDQTFGPDATKLTLSLELDLDERRISSQVPEVSENPVKVNGAKENMKAGGANSPVAGANAQGSPTADGIGGASGAGGDDYKGDKSEKIFAEGKTLTETTKALGTVKTMAISVLANEAKKIDPLAVEKYLKGYLGPKAEDPNFTVTVTTASFDTSSAAKATADMAAAKRSEQMQQIFSLVPIFALFVVGFMVIKALSKTAKNSQNVLVTAMPGGAIGPGLTLTSGGLMMFSDDDEEEFEVEGEGGVAVKKKKKKKRAVEEDDEDEEVGKIRQRLNLPLEQIKRLSNDKPETVAMLIKSWLLEEKK